jgi:hypothetical protein
VQDEVAGQLRLAAAASLLRLARRHDSRLGAGCYCMLALVMQDNQIAVRGVFAAKVYKLVNYFNVSVSAAAAAHTCCCGCCERVCGRNARCRLSCKCQTTTPALWLSPTPNVSQVFMCVQHLLVVQMRRSTHQLAAKYAAMLPLAAVDPELSNKEAAARMLREWVHSRRAAVQASIMSAAAAEGGAAGVRGGGSTLQDQPEMLLPYGLYILAHHPDFPQVCGC